MTWKPSEDHDREIRRWMKGKGWEVNRTNYDADRGIYAWRHELRGGKSPTLRISRRVLEDYPAFVVVHHLDELKVAPAMRTQPDARLVVVQEGSTVRLREMQPHLVLLDGTSPPSPCRTLRLCSPKHDRPGKQLSPGFRCRRVSRPRLMISRQHGCRLVVRSS